MLLSVTNKKTNETGKIIIYPYPNILHRDLAMLIGGSTAGQSNTLCPFLGTHQALDSII